MWGARRLYPRLPPTLHPVGLGLLRSNVGATENRGTAISSLVRATAFSEEQHTRIAGTKASRNPICFEAFMRSSAFSPVRSASTHYFASNATSVVTDSGDLFCAVNPGT